MASIMLIYLVIALFIEFLSPVSATCYLASGQIATNEVPCPNSSHCCPAGDTCLSNGLCQDKNNFNNGSTVTFPDGETYNYTGLYSSGSCINQDSSVCSLSCSSFSTNSDPYIWSCNDDLTSYCCHLDSNALAQFDCCQNATFGLPSPIALAAVFSSSTSFAPSITQSSTTTMSSIAATTSVTTSATSASASSSVIVQSSTSTAIPQSGGGISRGAIAGIVIGVLLAFGVGMGIMYFLLRRRKDGFQFGKKHPPSKDASNGKAQTYEADPSMSLMEMAAGEVLPIGELDGQQQPAELPTHNFSA